MLDVIDARLINLAKCGTYKSWCCLTEAEFAKLLEMIDVEGADFVRNLYAYTCVCESRKDNSAAVVHNWVERMCAPTVIASVLVVNEAVEAALIFGSKVIPNQALVALLATAAATQAWLVACAGDTVTESIILSICRALTNVKASIEDLPDAVQTVLSPLSALIEMAVVSETLKNGCYSKTPGLKEAAWVKSPQSMAPGDPHWSPWLTPELVAMVGSSSNSVTV